MKKSQIPLRETVGIDILSILTKFEQKILKNVGLVKIYVKWRKRQKREKMAEILENLKKFKFF